MGGSRKGGKEGKREGGNSPWPTHFSEASAAYAHNLHSKHTNYVTKYTSTSLVQQRDMRGNKH